MERTSTARRWNLTARLGVLSLLLSLLLLTRVLAAESTRLGFLPWNLLLAWVPYGLSLGIAKLARHIRPGMGLLVLPTFVWLLFFPNAPYIVTDLLHLRNSPPGTLGVELSLIAAFAALGMTLAVLSLRTMHGIVTTRLGHQAGWVFATGIVFLAGLGVWVGRALRWNSWDILRDPLGLLSTTYRSLTSADSVHLAVPFVLLFGSCLLAIYRVCHRPDSGG